MGCWRTVAASDRAPASIRWARDGQRLRLDLPPRGECVPLIFRPGRRSRRNRSAGCMADGLSPSATSDGRSCAQRRATQASRAVSLALHPHCRRAATALRVPAITARHASQGTVQRGVATGASACRQGHWCQYARTCSAAFSGARRAARLGRYGHTGRRRSEIPMQGNAVALRQRGVGQL